MEDNGTEQLKAIIEKQTEYIKVLEEIIKKVNILIDILNEILPKSTQIKNLLEFTTTDITPIRKLQLSNRAENPLIRNNFHFIQDLLHLSDEKIRRLRKIRNFGKACMNELLTKMEDAGYDEWCKKVKEVLKIYY